MWHSLLLRPMLRSFTHMTFWGDYGGYGVRETYRMSERCVLFAIAFVSIVVLLFSGCGRQKDPFQPGKVYSVVASFSTPGYAQDVYVADAYAYVVDDQAGVWVIDVSHPETPRLVTTLGRDESATNVEAVHILEENSIALVADYDIGLLIYDVSNVTNPQLLNVAFDRDIEGTFGIDRGDTIFVFGADRHEGFKVNRYEKQEDGKWNWFYYTFFMRIPFSWGDALDVVASEEYAFVANDHIGLEIIDLALPEGAAHVRTVDTPGGARAASLLNHHIYLAAYQKGVQIIDVSDPYEASVVGSYEEVDRVVDVYAADGYVYVADRSEGLLVLDVSDPARPSLVGQLETPYAQGVFATGSHIYVADRDSGLLIVGREP